MPEAASAAVARAVLDLVAPAPDDLLIEVGAGTGQIGCHLCAAPVRYVGFDSSQAMLEVFERRCRAPRLRASLIHSDGRRRWPFDDGTVKAVFGSRALHLLPAEHVATEVHRVADPAGAALVMGRVQRTATSLRSRMRRQLHELLGEAGARANDGPRQEERILDACRARGAVAFERRVAASWPVRQSARQVLDSWRGKPGLAGVDLSPAVQDEILGELERWAAQTFGSLEAEHSADEDYVLAGAWLGADMKGPRHEE